MSVLALAAGLLVAGAFNTAAADEAGPEDNRLATFGFGSVVYEPLVDGEPIIWDRAFPSNANLNWLLRSTEGGLVALDGTAALLADLPAGVEAGPVRDAVIANTNAAWAVTEDGSVHKWGRGTVASDVPNRSWSPDDLGGPAVAVSHQLAMLEDGTLVYFDRNGAVDPVDGPGVVEQVSAWGGIVRLADGSVGRVTLNNGNYAELIEASANIADISVGYAVSQDGTVYALVGNSASEVEHLPQGLDGQIVRAVIAGAGVSYALTDAGEIVGWNPATGDAPPEASDIPEDVVNANSIEGFFDSITNNVAVWYTEGEAAFSVDTDSQISGSPVVGASLAGTPATFRGDPEEVSTEFRYEGSEDALPDSENVPTYTVREADLGESIVFVTTASKEGFDDPIISISEDPVGPIIEPEPVAFDGVPQIEGLSDTTPPRAVIGSTVTGIPAEFEGHIVGEPIYDWIYEFRGDVTVLGEGIELLVPNPTVAPSVQFRMRVTEAATGEEREVHSTSTATAPPVVSVPNIEVEDGGPEQVGETLIAEPSVFTPDNGTEIQHRWYRTGDEDGAQPELIEDATGDSYTLSSADVGHFITYRTHGVLDSVDYELTSQPSNEIGPVENTPLAITGVPTIVGNPWIGEELTVQPAPVNDPEADISFQWYADGEEIDGATGDSWTVDADYEGQVITVVQVVSRDGATEGPDFAESDPSEPTAPVREAPEDLAVAPDGAADIAGVRIVGQTLSGVPATFTDTSDDVVVTSYWVINGTAEEADANELVLSAEHVGANIAFRSVAVRALDEAEATSTSETVIGPVLAALAVDTEVSLSGDAEIGATLRATPAVFNDAEATLVHTWLVDGDPVDHEGLTFELTDEHEGQVIGFRSEATRVVDGIEESESSEAFSAEVALPDDEDEDDGEGSPTRPGDDDEALRCLIATPDTVSAGSAHEVTVDLSECGDWAGHEVRIWLFSDPVDLGTVTVGADGTFAVTIPAGVPAGAHQLAVYEPDGGVDENGNRVDVLIGYADLTITGDGAGGPGGSGSGLPATGYEGSLSGLLLAVLLILAGGIALVAARMRKELRI